MANKDDQELSDHTVARITQGIRGLAEDRVERGVELNRPVRCDSCSVEKPAAGATLYGAYKLCNDCLLEFALALASSKVDNVSDFMRRPEGDLPASDVTDLHERRSAPVSQLPGRDKLMPQNEPF